MATISLCMIVKNEETVLARCLDSVQHLADEIIIVDTGSDDSTREIASRYTNKIYSYPWAFDFAAARDFSFSKATQKYIFWMDADDVFEVSHMEDFLFWKECDFQNADMIFLPYHIASDESGNPLVSCDRERIVRNHAGFSWEGCVHEVLTHPNQSNLAQLRLNIPIIHCSAKTSYSDRNLLIYEKQIQSSKTLTLRDTFYYGRELFYHEKWEEAIHHLTVFLQSSGGWKENKIEACRILAQCFQHTSSFESALAALFYSFSYDTPRAEVCCDIGEAFLQKQQYQQAIFWYRMALTRPKDETSGAFILHDCYDYLPCMQLCVCYDRLGNLEKAELYNKKAGLYHPDSAAYLQNLEYFQSLRK